MSEATLKKKTRTQYRNISVGSKNGGFSLNGTRRSQGYVGQTMLGRHFPRTPMRGNVARGSGGCCGKYYMGTIVQSGVPFPTGINGNSANNNPQVVKSSVINNNGLIMTKYKWIRRPQPYASVKQNALNDDAKIYYPKAITISQSAYIHKKSSTLIKNLLKCNDTSICKPNSNACRSRPFGSVIHYPRAWSSVTKTAGSKNVKLGPISQYEFISALTGNCSKITKNMIKVSRAPLPGPPASYR